MAKIQDPGTVLPGDVIQITEKGPLFMSLMMVEECRRTFTRARMPVPGAEEISWNEHRVPAGAYERVGTAKLVEADTHRARETMIATLKSQGRVVVS